MATQSSKSPPPPSDPTLPQILAALQAIADAVDRGTDVLVDPADERAPTQEQSTTIVDYLVLRELVGRQADERRRTVGATRFTPQTVIFDGEIPADAAQVAVFTRRSAAPDDLVDILFDDGPVVDLVKKVRGRRQSSSDPVIGFVLDNVTDDQPIARIELRDVDDFAVALGPRLAPVT